MSPEQSEKLKRVEAIAGELAGEIEWIDFFPPMPGGREVVSGVMADPWFARTVRERLATAFIYLRRAEGELPIGHQEDELEAAGLLGSAIKFVLVQGLVKHGCPGFIVQEIKEGALLTVKWRRFAHPVTQSPPGARVPSMAAQNRRVQMGMPPIDLEGGHDA